MQPLISVIVPVYKVEEYLDQCVNSIVNQTYQNLEIILVDDGSPDNCPAMCDKWAKLDDRIRVIHQKNKGGGEARNVALDLANGAYIAFVDSDDYISPLMYDAIMDAFTDEVDIVECNYTTTKTNHATLSSTRDFTASYYDVEKAMELHIKDAMFRQIIWNKVFRKNVITNTRFPCRSKIDDEFWTYKVIGNARKLAKIDAVYYAYRQQDTSVMHTLKSIDRLRAVEARYKRHEYVRTNFPSLYRISAVNLCGFLMYTGQLLNDDQSCKNYRDVWRYMENIFNYVSSDMDGLKITMPQKLWVILAKYNLRAVCIIRNILHLGV